MCNCSLFFCFAYVLYFISLITIADISCDINGSIEFLEKTTTVEHPFFHYEPNTGHIYDHIKTQTITVLGVDILPTELARESSQHFGNALLPLLTKIFKSKNNGLSLPLELERACIAESGNLKPRYDYLATLVEKASKQEVDIGTKEDYQHAILISLEVR